MKEMYIIRCWSIIGEITLVYTGKVGEAIRLSNQVNGRLFNRWNGWEIKLPDND